MKYKDKNEKYSSKNKKRFNKKNFSSDEEDQDVCYNYRKSGHVKKDCPKLKEKSSKDKKKDLMICDVSEDDISDEDDEPRSKEKNQVCKMALGDEDETNHEVFENQNYTRKVIH